LGFLSPLLWFLVNYELFVNRDKQGFKEVGFADDLVIILKGKVDSADYATEWCKDDKLSINSKKSIVVR
jgi:hypothetical protein